MNEETRTVDVDVEHVNVTGNRLTGHAAVFDCLSEPLAEGYRERIAKGAFASVLEADADVRLLVDHKPPPLARTRAGTLRLHEDDTGLAFEADLPDTQYARDLRTSLTRGDLDGMSFSFTIADEDWDGDVRVVKRVASLRDICIACFPAYPETSVQLRTRNTSKENEPPVNTDTTTGASSTTETTGTSTPNITPNTTSTGLQVEDRTAANTTPTIDAKVSTAILNVSKGETRSLSGSAADAITPPQLATFLFDYMRKKSVALQTGIRVIPTDRDSIQWPQVTSDPTPGWYAELDTITASDPAFTTITATPKKLAVRTEVSNEVWEDSEPSASETVRNLMLRAMAEKLDAAFFQGTGLNNQPTGLRATSGTQSVSMGTNGAAITNLDPIADAINLLEGVNTTAGAIVMHPGTWGALRKLKELTTGSNKPLLSDPPSVDARPTIFGVPVYVTSNMAVNETQGSATTASSIWVYSVEPDFGPLIVRRTDATVEIDRSRLFDKDASELRGRVRMTVVVPQATAVCRIVGVIP